MWSFNNADRGEMATWRIPGAAWSATALIWMAGCGGSPPAKAVTHDEVPAKAAAKPERVAAADHGEKSPSKKKKESDIPYDAFFDNPLEVASEKGVIAGNDPGPMKEEPGEKTTKTDAPKPAAGGEAWSEVLPAENLQAEMKKVQNRLKASMQNPGTYNGNYKEIAVDGAVIAGLAGMAIEHSGDFSWKKNAPLIRDFGYDLSQAATGLGKENYEKTKVAYERLDSVFSGSIPPNSPTPAPKRPFSETADRTGLMKRIDRARGHLRDNINTEAKLKSDAEGVVHETLMISSLGKIVATDGYSSADEQDYQQFANALISGAKDATAAAKDQSFQKFTDAMNKVNKSCDQCHANYGNG